MQKELEEVSDHLCSDSYARITLGLTKLESFLKWLAPSVRKYNRTALVDHKLATFINLQNNIQYNIANSLVPSYVVFARPIHKRDSETIIKANLLLSGILLIHPESRALFGRRNTMKLFLSFLDSNTLGYSEDVKVSFVSLLVHILIKEVKNMRVFETSGGCQLLIHHLGSLNKVVGNDNYARANNQELLHFKVIEFLIFYLADESELLSLPQNAGVKSATVEEKAHLFRSEFPAIDDLIKNLNHLTSLRSAP